MRPEPLAFALALAAAGAACQTASAPPAAQANPLLTSAGFVARKPATPGQAAAYSALPANRMVKQTANGKTTYLYADPGCGCVHVGSPQAFQAFKGMGNTVYEMNRNTMDPGLDMGSMGDLDSWSPL